VKPPASTPIAEAAEFVEHATAIKHVLGPCVGGLSLPKAGPKGPKRRMKLVFLIRSLGAGGAQRQLVELAKGLDRKLFNVTVLCFYPEGALVRELLSARVPVVSLNKRGRWEVCRFLLRMAQELRKQRPDILHPYMTGPNLIAMLMKPLLRSTRIVWGMRASNVELTGIADKMLARLEALLASRASLVIFNSAAGRAFCRSSGFAKARSVVIPNGVDVTRFSPDRRTGAQQRKCWGISTSSLVIGLVGRIDPMKDHRTFLKAAAILAKSRANARFVCIGSGPDGYVNELHSLARELGADGRIVWTGIINDMPSAYRALDICCSSSAFGEGTPNCVAEAMACGVPCVVTDVGDSRLVVGETGIAVPPNDPEALARGLAIMANRIVQEPELGNAARARIVSNFSLPMLVAKTSEALLALA
jgi:glycosyltransferase involved in cell wall biosynthesis